MNNFIIVDNEGFKDLAYLGSEVPGDTVIYTLSGTILNQPTKTSIQISKNEHIEDELGQYINHNCNPNVKIVDKYVISLKQISDGDSITFNYNDSEDKLSNPFICNCCNKEIIGKK